MKRANDDDVARNVRDGPALDRAMINARRHVVELHKRAGVPLVVWEDDRVVEIDPATVVLPPPEVDAPAKPARGRRDGENKPR